MYNSLVIIGNKKFNIHCDILQEITRAFASGCYYFDKIAVVAYDNSKCIGVQFKECREGYDNTVVVCPRGQMHSVSDYMARLYGAQFDTGNVLSVGDKSVFLCSDDADIANFSARCVQLLNEKYHLSYDKFYVKCVGAPAELIDKTIQQVAESCADMSLAVYGDYDDRTIEVTYSSNTPKMTADNVQRALVTALNDYIYALEDITLQQRLYQLLKLRRMKLSVAESFTGGGISKRLVQVPGISEVYFEGLNTYANESKMSRLNVSEATLKYYGAVSEETARRMAEGLIASGNCDIAIATTGIAGPKSDNTKKPVGLAYIAIGLKGETYAYPFNFKGDRQTITEKAINHALFLAYKTLK